MDYDPIKDRDVDRSFTEARYEIMFFDSDLAKRVRVNINDGSQNPMSPLGARKFKSLVNRMGVGFTGLHYKRIGRDLEHAYARAGDILSGAGKISRKESVGVRKKALAYVVGMIVSLEQENMEARLAQQSL